MYESVQNTNHLIKRHLLTRQNVNITGTYETQNNDIFILTICSYMLVFDRNFFVVHSNKKVQYAGYHKTCRGPSKHYV